MEFRSKKLNVRGLQYHIQEWGDASKPTLFLLHGWMDCGASFQFIAPSLVDHFHLVAPDWRGFGESEHAPGGYYFPDYFADLDLILEHFSPHAPVQLVGHSMGGQIALMYAGIRADRVSSLLSLEAIGLNETQSDQAPRKYRKWMAQILSNEPSRVYPDCDSLMRSIHAGNPALSTEMVEKLAEFWGKPIGDNGAVMLKHDHKHRYANPVRYNFDDTVEVWKQITARVGLVMATDSYFYSQYTQTGRLGFARNLLSIKDADYFLIEQCNHMLHLEKPEQTAASIQTFFSAC